MSPASKNPRVLCTLAFVFFAGAVVGALSMRLGLHERLHRTVSAASLPPAAKIPDTTPAADAWLKHYKTELNLTDAQTQQIAGIAADYRRYYKSLQDQLDDLRATGKNNITQVLTEQQRKKFDQLVAEPLPPTK